MTVDTKILTVSQLNDYVKMLIDSNPMLGNIWVRGEVSNLTFHTSGHLYFSVKDEKSRVSAIMFRTNAVKLKFRPENGMKVVLHGRVSVFPRDGVYQIYVTSIEPDGIGALYIAYEQLRRRLEAEGLFDERIKKALPKIPSAVGVITSPTGAAVRDIINVTARRFPFAKIILFPSLVQGDGAESNLIEGIRYFNSARSADVIIIGRGGGSIEDLWAFNSELLAREIRMSAIPVISAVGHETDYTICDFAADRRAPTPSAAAELAVPDAVELKLKARKCNGKDRKSCQQGNKAYQREIKAFVGKQGAYKSDCIYRGQARASCFSFKRYRTRTFCLGSGKEKPIYQDFHGSSGVEPSESNLKGLFGGI